ncbi:hypothetical protein HII31_07034 [Pseudocercospora fuligena]|uniref:MARVEL domain-containing protein n=1 Tax=Pseudocercospora fuligena TaxID=685502 RepID=A0A8H6VIB2_9PEZI|nr:hypothetical protein HII31_07034 [Pseudocercospora fuligena]
MPPPPPSSSLSILMPKYEQAQNPESKKQDRTATELELERLSRAVIDSINNRSFQAPKKLVAKNYRADIDELPKTNDYDENEKDFRRVAKENPEYHIDVIDVTPDVDEVSGYAIVYCLLSVRGRPANFAFACTILSLSVHFYQEIQQAIFDCKESLPHERPDLPISWCRDSSGKYPPAIFYSGVVAGFGLIDALIGVLFTGCLSFNVSLDICAMAFYLAAGINFAVVYDDTWAGHRICDGPPCSGKLADLICLFLASACTVTTAALAIWDKRVERSHTVEGGGAV